MQSFQLRRDDYILLQDIRRNYDLAERVYRRALEVLYLDSCPIKLCVVYHFKIFYLSVNRTSYWHYLQARVHGLNFGDQRIKLLYSQRVWKRGRRGSLLTTALNTTKASSHHHNYLTMECCKYFSHLQQFMSPFVLMSARCRIDITIINDPKCAAFHHFYLTSNVQRLISLTEKAQCPCLHSACNTVLVSESWWGVRHTYSVIVQVDPTDAPTLCNYGLLLKNVRRVSLWSIQSSLLQFISS